MLKTIDEIKEAEIEAGVVVNGIDNPNILSVDSTDVITTKIDKIELSEDEKKALPPAPKEEVEVKTETEKNAEAKKEKVVKPEPESKKVAKRIGDLTKKWRTEQREKAYEKEKRIEAEEKLKKYELAENKTEIERPQKEDFDDEDDYIEALIDWKDEIKVKASQKEVVKEIKDKDEKQAVADSYEGLDDAIDKGSEKYDDWDDVVMNEDLVISPELTQVILDTENPEDVMYHLASDPEESARISDLDTISIAREIGKIEVTLAKAEKKVEDPVVDDPTKDPAPSATNSLKKQTSAPEPITPVKTTGVTEKDPNKMSPKEYREWREGQV